MQINANIDDRIIYIPIFKTYCILGPQNWLNVFNLLPTSSCLLPVQLAGVKCQKMEINISNDGLTQNYLPVTIYYLGKLRIELQTLNYYVFNPIQTPIPSPIPPDYVHYYKIPPIFR